MMWAVLVRSWLKVCGEDEHERQNMGTQWCRCIFWTDRNMIKAIELRPPPLHTRHTFPLTHTQTHTKFISPLGLCLHIYCTHSAFFIESPYWSVLFQYFSALCDVVWQYKQLCFGFSWQTLLGASLTFCSFPAICETKYSTDRVFQSF